MLETLSVGYLNHHTESIVDVPTPLRFDVGLENTANDKFKRQLKGKELAISIF